MLTHGLKKHVSTFYILTTVSQIWPPTLFSNSVHLVGSLFLDICYCGVLYHYHLGCNVVFCVMHFTSCTVGITHRFHLWPYSHRSNVTYFSIIPRSAQYVDYVLYDFRDGDNPQPSLPNTYCICSSDYTHKTGNKTTAYGTTDGLERAIWGPSIILVFRSPLLYGNLGQTLSSLLPFE